MSQRDSIHQNSDAPVKVSYRSMKRDGSDDQPGSYRDPTGNPEPRLFPSHMGINPIHVGMSQYTDTLISPLTRRPTKGERLPLSDSYFDEDFAQLANDPASDRECRLKPSRVQSSRLNNETGLILNVEKINQDDLLDFLVLPKPASATRNRSKPQQSTTNQHQSPKGKTYKATKRDTSPAPNPPNRKGQEPDHTDLSYSGDPYANSGVRTKTPKKITPEQFTSDVVSRLDGWQKNRTSKVAKMRQEQATRYEIQNTHHPKLLPADSGL
jgi:hypothetical protein